MKLSIDYLEYENISKELFYSNYFQHKPCIIKGCLENWKANNWEFDTLKSIKLEEEYRGNIDRVFVRKPGAKLWKKCHPSDVQKIRQKLGGTVLEYEAHEWLFSQTHPELMEQIKIPEYLGNNDWLQKIPAQLKPNYPRILIGYEGTGSRLHSDSYNTSNWMALVRGKKRWLVIPPEEQDKVREFVGIFTPNIEEITSRVSNYYDCELMPGEIIYLPGSWLHQVFNTEDSIGITYNIFNLLQLLSYWIFE